MRQPSTLQRRLWQQPSPRGPPTPLPGGIKACLCAPPACVLRLEDARPRKPTPRKRPALRGLSIPCRSFSLRGRAQSCGCTAACIVSSRHKQRCRSTLNTKSSTASSQGLPVAALRQGTLQHTDAHRQVASYSAARSWAGLGQPRSYAACPTCLSLTATMSSPAPAQQLRSVPHLS